MHRCFDLFSIIRGSFVGIAWYVFQQPLFVLFLLLHASEHVAPHWLNWARTRYWRSPICPPPFVSAANQVWMACSILLSTACFSQSHYRYHYDTDSDITTVCLYTRRIRAVKRKNVGRGFAFALVLTQLMEMPEVLIVENYQTLTSLSLVDTHLGVGLPCLASAFSISLLRQTFKTVPEELEDAARVEGLSSLGYLKGVCTAPLAGDWLLVGFTSL